MSRESKPRLYPRYSDFEDLEVEWDDNARWRHGCFASILEFFQRRTGTEVVAIVTLLVLGYGFYAFRGVNTSAQIWGLCAIDFLIVSFSTIVILIGRADAKDQEKENNRQDESGNEPDGS